MMGPSCTARVAHFQARCRLACADGRPSLSVLCCSRARGHTYLRSGHHRRTSTIPLGSVCGTRYRGVLEVLLEVLLEVMLEILLEVLLEVVIVALLEVARAPTGGCQHPSPRAVWHRRRKSTRAHLATAPSVRSARACHRRKASRMAHCLAWPARRLSTAPISMVPSHGVHRRSTWSHGVGCRST